MRKCTIFALSLSLLAANAAMAFAQPRYEGRADRWHEDHFDRDRGRPEWRDGYRMDRGDWDRGNWDRGRHPDHRDYRFRDPPPGCE